MCGLAGFLEATRTLPSEELHAIVGRMAGTVRHRGPDAGGAWVDPSIGVALGFRRLAILDLSEGGSQPMVSACGRYVTVFNGEIYNFRALRARLEAAGHDFRGHSDTEVMLAAFTAWGVEEALPRLNGMFAFVVWDRAARVLRLARDRVGEKPLYYGWTGRSFLFGSELKVLRAHPAFRAGIDRSALALYLRHKYVPAPFSIYNGVRKLPPGTLLTLGLDAAGQLPEPRPYWSAREVAETGPGRWRDAGDATDALDELLRDAVRLRMEADVPPRRFPFRRHRLLDGRRPHAGAEQPPGQDLHHRLPGPGLQRGRRRPDGGQAPRHRSHRTVCDRAGLHGGDPPTAGAL
jgi:asparagine synthase (glutamine-hydrolysing)